MIASASPSLPTTGSATGPATGAVATMLGGAAKTRPATERETPGFAAFLQPFLPDAEPISAVVSDERLALTEEPLAAGEETTTIRPDGLPATASPDPVIPATREAGSETGAQDARNGKSLPHHGGVGLPPLAGSAGPDASPQTAARARESSTTLTPPPLLLSGEATQGDPVPGHPPAGLAIPTAAERSAARLLPGAKLQTASPPARPGRKASETIDIPSAPEIEAEPSRPGHPQALPALTSSSGAPLPANAAAAAPSVPVATATAMPSASSNPGSAALAAAPSAAVEQFVEQIEGAREAGRAVRPEMTVRHGEFGPVTLRIEPAAGAGVADWRATLVARDPGFLPAVQIALGERAAQAFGDSAMAQRGQDAVPNSSGSGSGGGWSGGWPGSGAPSEDRYGSSTGSGQGAAKPCSGEEAGSCSNPAAADTPDLPAHGPTEARGRALFA